MKLLKLLAVTAGLFGLMVHGVQAKEIKIGVIIPESGPAGLFGPSSRNIAEMAAADINAAGGIKGNKIKLVYADSGLAPAEVVQSVVSLWKGEGVKALIGMHNSAVREAVAGRLQSAIPYIYTPVHAGAKCEAGIYITGETPNQQLDGAMPYLMKNKKVSKWYLIGHDYIWPRSTNEVAKQVIAKAGGTVVGEEYVPLTASEFDSTLQKIKASGADAVFVTLVGGGSVGFNKAYAGFGLDKQAIRLGTLIEENTLAGIGAGNTKGLYNSAGYFANLDNSSAKAFAKRYYETYGDDAPALNGLGESLYEGLMLLQAMGNKASNISTKSFDKVAEGIKFTSPRGAGVLEGRHVTQDTYLADGSSGTYKVIKTFKAVKSSESCSN